MKTLIIEDEKAAVRNLQSLLSVETPQLEIVATLDSVSDVLDWLQGNPLPELIFMDIHLADGSAFEIFEYVDISCPVIFTTAYDEYALKAFKVNSIDYLLKPIGREDVRKAMNKLQRLCPAETPVTQDIHSLIRAFRREATYKTHFLIPVKGDKLLPLPVEDILCFHIEEGMVKAITNEGKEYLLSQSIDELSESLNPQDFFRVNRQHLIARKAIRDIDLWFNNRLSVNLKVDHGEKILVSRARVTEFKEWFTGG